MLDLFDDLAGPMDELTEAANEAGLGDELGFLEDANDAMLKAIMERGVPPETYRFLHHPPDPSKRTSQSDDTEDLVTQGGHILDHLTGNSGYGALGAAFANDKFIEKDKNKATDPSSWEMEHPYWAVEDLNCHEEMDGVFECELILVRPALDQDTPGYTDPWKQFVKGWEFDKTRDQGALKDKDGKGLVMWTPDPILGIPIPHQGTDVKDTGLGRDLGEGVGGTKTFIDKVLDPKNSLKEFADVENPDQLHPLTYATPITAAVDPSEFLLKPCRVSIARRFTDDRFTLSERWFTGVAIEFEDLGVNYKRGYRAVRIVVVPRLWFLSRTRRSRIFQDKTALEIVTGLLKEYGLYDLENEVDWDGMKAKLRLEPPPKELLGAVSIPGAAIGLVDAVGGAVDAVAGAFGANTGLADTVSGALQKSVEDWGNKREYCVQYNETDLEFVQRLLAEEGATYWFESTERTDTLVLADDPMQAGKKILTLTRYPLKSDGITAPSDATLAAAEIAWSHYADRRLVPTSVTLRDNNMSFPRSCTDLQAGEQVLGIGGGVGVGSLLKAGAALVSELGGKEGMEDYAGSAAKWFEFPAGVVFVPGEDKPLWDGADYKAYQGPELATFLLERFRVTGALTHAGSNCTMIQPGNNIRVGRQAFDVLREDDVFDTKLGLIKKAPRYVVTRAVHRGGLTRRYRNTFEAYHVKLRYRPVRKAKPKIEGVQSATVIGLDLKDTVGTGGVPEPQIDKRWRVLVRFPWDLRTTNPTDANPETGAHSCWIRAAQRWAGEGYGTLFAPRVGMEALVGFRDGDPDQPILLGTIYNGHYQSPNLNTYHPYRHESQKPKPNESDAQNVSFLWTQSWPAQEASTRADQRANFLFFNDARTPSGEKAEPREQVVLHAQRDLEEDVAHDHITTVLRHQNNAVLGKHEEIVGGDQKLFVNHPSVVTDPLDAGRKKEVLGNEEIKIGKEGNGLRHTKIDGNEVRVVKGDRKEGVLQAEVLEIHGEGPAPEENPDAKSQTKPEQAKGPARPAPARDLTVHGGNKVQITGNDELDVAGDRKEAAAKAYEVLAASIQMVIAGNENKPADQQSGIQVTKEGVAARSEGEVRVESKTFKAVSEDEIHILARTVIRLEAGDNLITLDGIAGTITINAETEGGIWIGEKDGTSYLKVTNLGFEVRAGDSHITGETSGTEAGLVVHSSEVDLQFSGEIFFNARGATDLQHAAGEVDQEATTALEDYRKEAEKFDAMEKQTWAEIKGGEGVAASEAVEAPATPPAAGAEAAPTETPPSAAATPPEEPPAAAPPPAAPPPEPEG